ncbi:MAG: DUF1580 domain-containing protein [Planctomycetaceae bacterium]|nr:DUF1580 domain-containing protein [Planctomycetaceae bacterium]
MGIDPSVEEAITLPQATKLLPHRRGGKKANVATLYRWTSTGCKGVKLEFIQIGGSRCTSREALHRFFERLTAAANGHLSEIQESRTSSQRQASSAKALSELKRKGV